jgi:serine protease
MGRSRSVSLVVVLALVLVAAAVRSHGQAPVTGRTILQTIGLPAVDVGVLSGSRRAPVNGAVVTRPHQSSRGVIDRAGASGAPYVPGRVIVKFKGGASSAARLSAMSSLSTRAQAATLAPRPAWANFDVMRIDPNADAEAMAQALAARSDVEYAQADYRIYPRFVPNDKYYADYQWNLPLIDMQRAWDIQPQAGSAITVAILDTGLAYTDVSIQFHADAIQVDPTTTLPALGDVVVPFATATDIVNAGRVVSPHDFIWNDTLPVDLDGHGTHVAGTLGELTNNGTGMAGVAFNVKLMPVKVLDSVWDDIFGSPNYASDEVVAQGIRYAADNGAKIINMSLGRTGPGAPVIEDAINYAVSKGAFVAVAGGNDAEDGNPTEVVAEIASRIRGAVSVAAVDRAKAHAYYSNTGSYIELAAPGGSDRGFGANGFVWQQTYDYDYTDTYLDPSTYAAPRFDILAYVGYIGTSMATPHVSGVAAMLMQQGITDPKAIEAALEQFADDLGPAGRDDSFGFGLINARNTLRGLGLAK